MTPQEIQERNKQIALMLGKKYENNRIVIHFDNVCGVNPSGETWRECSYHSDWNWLMEAVEFIEKLNNYFIQIEEKSCYVYDISKFDNSQANAFIIKDGKTKKEAVFIAVSDFAKLYNENKL
jgi:hypothetical protein